MTKIDEVVSDRSRLRFSSLVLAAGASIAGALLVLSLKLPSGGEPRDDQRPFTMYLLGGSVALGEPYFPTTDFGRMTSWILGGRIDGRTIEIVNMGGYGKPSRVVVDDARRIAASRPGPGGSIALLCVGNNEYLNFDDSHDLAVAERRLFDVPTLDAAGHERALEAFRRNLESIIVALQGASVSVVATTIPVNLKDWEPNRSTLSDPGNAGIVRSLLEDGERKLASGDAFGALRDFQGILAREPYFAHGAKRAGDCCEQMGNYEAARRYYQMAVDFDANPYRETGRQLLILQEVCRQHGVPIVDGVGIFEAASANRLVGFNLMWDNCHPTLEGYALLALGFARQLQQLAGAKIEHKMFSVAELEQALGISERVRAQVLRSRGQYCYISSTLTWNPEARLRRSAQYLRQAAELGPVDADLLCSLGILAGLRGDGTGALDLMRQAFRLDPEATRQRVLNTRVAQIMKRYGVRDLLSEILPQ